MMFEKIDALISGVEKIKKLNDQGTGINLISNLIKILNNGSAAPDTLVIPHLKGFEVLKIPEIIMCQADGYCTNFFLTRNRKIVSSRNLKHFNELLEDHGFIRIHHSCLININHVSGYSRQGEVFLSEDNKAFLGDSYKKNFIKRFGQKSFRLLL